ncbi:MAG TPA: hypothetical protein VI727_04095 [Candidatus Brocadiaceae bacterium]|nr:hypothetical protein [Candidatus Brocadiaceae bacterium]
MSSVKPEPYSPDYKGYLTYPADPKINGKLLDDKKETRYIVTIKNKSAKCTALTTQLSEIIKSLGGSVERVALNSTAGKKQIFGIPASIRKIIRRGELYSIRIRVTGKTVQDVIAKLDSIKKNMVEWGIKPTECIWDRELS